jgi:hypothetical protein
VRLDEEATEIARVPGQAIDFALSSAGLHARTSHPEVEVVGRLSS